MNAFEEYVAPEVKISKKSLKAANFSLPYISGQGSVSSALVTFHQKATPLKKERKHSSFSGKNKSLKKQRAASFVKDDKKRKI
jgi:hypothetical protein